MYKIVVNTFIWNIIYKIGILVITNYDTELFRDMKILQMSSYHSQWNINELFYICNYQLPYYYMLKYIIIGIQRVWQ